MRMGEIRDKAEKKDDGRSTEAGLRQDSDALRGLESKSLGIIMAGLAVVVIALVLFALSAGRYQVPLDITAQILLSPITGQAGDWTSNEYNVVVFVRLPRVIAAVLIGIALALSGASYQGVFQNLLVSPDILGVSYGACVGAALSILLSLGSWQTQIFAFLGGLLTVLITVSIPRLMHRRSNIIMVLAGVIVGGFMSSVLGLLKYVADPETQLPDIVYWQLGSVAKADYGTLSYTAPVIVVAAAVIICMRWRLNIISLGEQEAQTLGINLRKERGVIIVASTLLTASAVSISGTIGWVGLIIPHITRRIVGADNKRLIPCCTLVAAAFMLIIDTIARATSGFEIPLSILTGFVGAPIFCYILIKQRNQE